MAVVVALGTSTSTENSTLPIWCDAETLKVRDCNGIVGEQLSSRLTFLLLPNDSGWVLIGRPIDESTV